MSSPVAQIVGDLAGPQALEPVGVAQLQAEHFRYHQVPRMFGYYYRL